MAALSFYHPKHISCFELFLDFEMLKFGKITV